MAVEPEPEVVAGRYRLGPVIGRGGMGEVRRARDQRLDRDVAVKFLRSDLAAEPEVRRRFEDEARAAAQLGHPNVVAIFDSGEHDDAPYIVMECLPGRTLADELAEGPLATARVRQVAAAVLGALAAAHRVGIVHRDVKPANILIADDGSAKVADFGIAKSTEGIDLTLAGQIIGTPAYLAPERLEGRRATPESDLYSLGVVLYEAVAGRQPFSGDTPLALAHAVHTTVPVPLRELRPDLDADLAATVERAMDKVPERRFRNAGDMADSVAGDRVAKATDGLATDGPAGDGPAGEGQSRDGPATTGLATDGPAGDGPAGDGPATTGLATDGPAAGSAVQGNTTRPVALGSTERFSAPPVIDGGPGAEPVRVRPGQKRSRLAAVLGVAALVVVGLMVLITRDQGTPVEPSPPSTASTTDPAATDPAATELLPPPLDDALRRLEEAVRG